ncbi:MAG: class I SAM-dependent methyltransferase [Thermotogae bacterium]|nr:MAG: class I SAM-dependent methyltransferase [Thermotogota bacterium]
MKPIDCESLYRDPRHYDLQHKDFVDDIPFYLRQIKKYGEPVLELACGTGRVTIPIAEQGIKITGLDISTPMLSYAKRKATMKGVDVEWVKADCRGFKLDKKFKLVFFPFNSIAHLHDLESIESCFLCVKAHLEDDGRFIIDVFNPRLDILMRDPSKRYPVAEYPDPDGRGTVVITENNTYDAASQINRIKWYYKMGDQAEEIVEELNMRIFYPQELDALLHYNGFTIESKFGNYDESPFVSTSPKQLIVCRTCG